MIKIYNTNIETDKIEEIKEFKKGSWISLVNPSEIEIKKVCENHKKILEYCNIKKTESKLQFLFYFFY